MQRETRNSRCFVFGLVLAMTATVSISCSSEKETSTKKLTDRQRDSTIAKSDLPGAGVVGKALEAADSSAVRAKALEEGP